MAKMWYRSKGFLVGMLGIAVAVVTALSMGMTWEKAALAGFSAAFAVIRTITSEKIAWSRDELEELNEVNNE